MSFLDLPAILSEDYFGFLDPREKVWKGESGKGYYLKNLVHGCSQVLEPFDGIFGFSKRLPQYTGQTLLRFPLRNKASTLSSEVYTAQKLEKLLELLKEEARYLLIFLRSVCAIEVYRITEKNKTLPIFSVSVSQKDYQTRSSNQKQLLAQVKSTFSSSYPHEIIMDSSRFTLEVVVNGSIDSKHELLVVNQVGSEDNEVMRLAKKQHVLPWVGTAVELAPSDSSGRVFCVLPLPIEDRTPFRVHVNGTFAVSSNRRSLKWEAQERKGDEESTWNKLLIEECIPACYFKLITELMELLNIDPSTVYSCWPVLQKVNGTPWNSLLEPFYKLLLYNDKAVHCVLRDSQWISIEDSVIIPDNEPVYRIIKQVVLNCGVNLVELESNQHITLNEYYDENIQYLTPSKIRNTLKKKLSAYNQLSLHDKMVILQYCLADNCVYANLIGLKLLPLANGVFKTFEKIDRSPSHASYVYICSPVAPVSLLPDVIHKLINVYNEYPVVHGKLIEIAEEDFSMVKQLTPDDVSKLLLECETNKWSSEQMEIFWDWLRDKDLSNFHSREIVPTKHHTANSVNIVPLAKQNRVIYVSRNTPLPLMLMTALEKCGIKFAHEYEFSYLFHSQIDQYLYCFEPNQVLDAITLISEGNIKFSNDEAIAIQTLLSDSDFNHSRLATISKLPLFKVLQNDETVRTSIKAVKTSNSNNKAIVMKGSYNFKTDLLSNEPLIVEAISNDAKLLKKIESIVCFMSETDYLQRVAFVQIKNRKFKSSHVVPLMQSVLDNFYSPMYKQVAQQLTSAMQTLPFVRVSSTNILEAPCKLFDPENEMLNELFFGENKFPASNFRSYLPILRQCGLRSSVTSSEILHIIQLNQAAVVINHIKVNIDHVKYCKIVAALKYLFKHSTLLYEIVSKHYSLLYTLQKQASQYCWLPVASKPPSSYPSCLAWKGSQFPSSLASASAHPLIVLSNDLASSKLPLIIGSQAVFVENVPTQLANHLCSSSKYLTPAVATHFKVITEKCEEMSAEKLKTISMQTYNYLSQNIDNCDAQMLGDKWIWLENILSFVAPTQVAVAANPSFRASLEPYVFVFPPNLQKFSQLFTKCDVSPTITTSQILSVLKSLKDTPAGSQLTATEVWSIVTSILTWLAEDTKRINKGNLLVPVESSLFYPQLYPEDEVAYTDNEMLRNIATASEEEYHLIHSKVSHLAPILGLTPLSDKLDITEDIFEDAGQHEPLTTRLSNILREYKDGLTIIKEMIQNADDAGATEVNILYDNRTHPTQNLLFKGMAESHGPALIVHNNSTFTNEDFENITKLAGATKANQPLKIGKFGVGFCSVYHITDVPSFVSGEWLYIFDPTLKYLKGVVRNESRPGKRVKYRSKFLAQSQQLAPYEDLFGFSASSDYNGTIFRLPFRTSASQISSTLYSNYRVQQMKDDLKVNGSKLLLFLQHVKRITFSSIQGGSEVSIDSSNEENGIKSYVTKSLLRSTTEYWFVSSQEELPSEDCSKPGTASVACHLVKEDSSYTCQAIEGNAFCFLPLSVPSTGLPVHVSANFAVMSNRSGIWTEGSSGVASDSRERWNQHLMTTVIPKAYCNLLKKLQGMCISGELILYNFFDLWPLKSSLQIKYPWEYMIPVLLGLISKENLFYSSSTHQWLMITESQFLHPLFQSHSHDCVSFHNAASILQLPVVSLPDSHLAQLKDVCDLDELLVTENEFAQNFLNKIKWFDSHIEIRNKILYIMLSATGSSSSSYIEISNQLQKIPCIPTSHSGTKLKLACKLVDPIEYQDMFVPDDEMFPFDSFYKNPLVREAMVKLGLMTNNISWDAIISSAKTIKNLFDSDENKALKRVKQIVKSIAQPKKTDCSVNILRSIAFLPVLQRPEVYILQWKGDGCTVLTPTEVIAANDLLKAGLISGSEKAIVNTDYGSGCGLIPYRVSQLLRISNQPTIDNVLNHFQCLIDLMSDDKSHHFLQEEIICRHIHDICQNVYHFFESNLIEEWPTTKTQEKLSSYGNKPFIWTGKKFIAAINVARNWKKDGPYLYKLPETLSMKRRLQEVLSIRDDFDINKLLDTLVQMYQENKENPLHSNCHDFIDVLTSELNTAKGNCEGREQIILVDQDYVLRPSTDLYYNDADWLQFKDDKFFLHKNMTSFTADLLGVKRIRSSFLNNFANESAFEGTEFGQREELTQRIMNILQDYPLNESFLKELLQNADDAKASKMYVILDKRHHGKESTLSKEWSDDLQGPAILVWNDKDFEDKDLVGIQKLGLGAKRNDDQSIGQFGIGFNVVYHVTDCPSFITRNSSILCVFDPHCRYVPKADKVYSGRQYDKLNGDGGFWNKMKDLRSCYLQDPIQKQPDCLKTGTLFRYPLRWNQKIVDESMILESKEQHPIHSAEVMEEKLSGWVMQIEEALLFLNNIKQFEFYVIQNDSHIFELRARYSVTLGDSAVQRRHEYQLHLSQQSHNSHLKDAGKTCVPKVFTYILGLHGQFGLVGNAKEERVWVIQQGIGNLFKPDQKWQFIGRTLPKHGLAIPLKPVERFSGKIFCFLPLPINSNLPLHINGQFVLNSNRRSLWSDSNDDKAKWNNQLVEAIASSYVYFLKELRHYIVSKEGYIENKDFYNAVNRYYGLFPYWMVTRNTPRVDMPTSQFVSTNVQTGSSLDTQWQILAKLVFLGLWTENVAILVSEAYDNNLIKPVWHVLHDDNYRFSQAYFLPGPQSKDVIPVLRRIGMTLTCALKVLHKHCKEFGSLIAKPEQTFDFYCNFHPKIIECPKIVKSTPFKSEQEFATFLKYIMKQCENRLHFEFFKPPYELPLLLTADGCIRHFQENEKVLSTDYAKLFPNSSSAFLHSDILKLRMSPLYFLQKKEVTFLWINNILKENLPSELLSSEVPDRVIDRTRLKSLWNCITCDESFSQHKKDILKHWALLPSTNHFLYQLDSSVIPIHCDQISDDEPVENESRVKNLLSNLLIPLLDHTVHKDAAKYCPSLSNFDKVFQIIYNRQSQGKVFEQAQLSNEDIDILLTYFSRTTFRHKECIKDQIKRFPIFKTVNGVFTTLINKSVYLWPEFDFCTAGYEKWALIESVVFLEHNGSWRKLCGNEFTILGKIPDEKEIYCKLIFPHFADLTEEERKKHLEYIRDHILDNALLQAKGDRDELAHNFLNNLKVLKCLLYNGTLLNIASFCDHTVKIFTTFPEHFRFLSSDYHDQIWLRFFRKLGLQVKIDFDTFIKLAKQISKGDHSDLENASEVVFGYIFLKIGASLRDEHQYKTSMIGDIRFVKTAKLKPYFWIKVPCSPPHWFQSHNVGLTKLNEAVYYKCASLIWTVKPVINLPVDLPSSMTEDEAIEILRQLGVTLEPDPRDVHQNIINISKTSLANPQLFSTYNPVLECHADENRVNIMDIVSLAIEYLREKDQIQILQKLRDVPCIPVLADEADESKPILVRPLQVVASESAKDFVPYLHCVPDRLYGIIKALHIMGVSDKLELRHINYTLRLMYEFHAGGIIGDPNDISCIQKAIYKLNDLLFCDIKKSEIESQLKLLYLPSQINQQQFKLVPSKNLLFKDTARFQWKELLPHQFSNSSYSMFKVPSSYYTVKVFKEKDFCLQLPKNARPHGFSLICHETIVSQDSTQDSPLVSHFRRFNEVFSQIAQQIPNMIYQALPSHISEKESGKFLTKLQEILTKMTVTPINDLRVRVRLDKDTECIGIFKVSYSLQKTNETYTLFVDKKATSGPTLWEEMAQTLCIEISRVLECDLVKFFKCRKTISDIIAIQTISDIQRLVDVQELELNDDEIGDDYVPKIGHALPSSLVRIVAQDINHIFRPQELVGYEMESNYYIWAMILYPENNSTSEEPTLKRYSIAWSESEEHKIVSSVFLHKFVTQEVVEESSETALVPSEGSTSELRQLQDSRELREIKSKIVKELKLIWNSDLTDEERKKAIRRMFLKYHPDKVTLNKPIYDEAFQYLLRQLDRLEKGLPLEEPEDDEATDGSCEPSHWRDYYASCRDFISRHNNAGGGGGKGGSERRKGGVRSGVSGGWEGHIVPKPDKIEAERWLRQAHSDLKAMKVLHNALNTVPVSCQVAFLAHEVIEKALKAGMYALIGINPNSESLVQHKLTSHAYAILSERPGQLEELPRIASEMESSYLDTRFPNRHRKPQAPVDIFQPDQARKKSDMADRVYELIKKVVAH